MSLSKLKQHLMQVKIASLGSLVITFNVDPETLRFMLQHFIQRGRVRLCTKTPQCGTVCSKCSSLNTEIYEWLQS